MKSHELISSEQLLRKLITGKAHVIDVRAPVEFLAGSIPGSINLPILTDEERTLVGTVYKQQGSAQAIALGHELVQGNTKALRLQAWVQEVQSNPENSFVACFRGGMRSQLAQQWLSEQGISISRLAGGYKKMRQLLIDETISFCQKQNLLILTGKTGAGKTQLLEKLKSYPHVNLEQLARHRGSAFGAYKTSQPTQIDFENTLSLALSKIKLKEPTAPVLVEDESRLIGSLVQPESFFHLLRQSPVLILNESLEVRIENTFQEYVASRIQDPDLFLDLQYSLQKIKSRLGGLRYQEISQDMRQAEKSFKENQDLSSSRIWIEKILSWYYDPAYDKSLAKRKPRILADGNRDHILAYLNN